MGPIRYIAGAVLIALAGAEPASAGPQAVDSLLTAAADTALLPGDREALLKQAVKQDPTGRAMHAMARFHMSLNTPTDRHTADVWLDRALRREPGNPDYVATRAELLWRSLRRPAAYDKAREALSLDPNHVWGLYWAGRFVTWSWMMTAYTYRDEGRDVRQAGDQAWIAGQTFRTFEYQDLDLASGISYLERALRVDPDHWPSRQELGLVFTLARRWAELVSLFQDDLVRHPDRAASWFFAGMGRQGLGDPDAAYAAYRQGLSRMPDRQRRFVQSVFLMRTPGAQARGEPLPDAEAIARFWFGRDPVFLTAENERMLEQCRRFAYADLRFSDPINGLSGWETDRGQAYIRYGDPEVMAMAPPGSDLGLDRMPGEERGGPGRPGPEQAFSAWSRTEVWSYDGFEITFANTNSWDSWRGLRGQVGRESVSFDELVDRIPDYYRYPLQYDLPYDLVQFRAAGGDTRLELYYALDGDRVARRPSGPGVDSVSVLQTLFVFDAAWDTVRHRAGLVHRMPAVDYPSRQERYLLASERLTLSPGRYLLAAEARDRGSGRVGTLRDSLRVRSFDGPDLTLSGILMARRILELEDRPAGRDRFLILPNPLRLAPRSGQASFYFEVYNLSQDAYGATHYRVTYQTRVVPEVGVPGGAAPWSTAVSSEVRGHAPWEPVRLTLDLDDHATGLRAFRVVVADLQDDEQAEETTTFRVMW